jgi:hypothetical protein
LIREKIGTAARFWGFSTASYPDLIEASPRNPLLTSPKKTVNGSFDQPSSAGVCFHEYKTNYIFIAYSFLFCFNCSKSEATLRL